MKATITAKLTATCVAFLTLTTIASTTLAESGQPDRGAAYRISIFENAPGSEAILSGDLAGAIRVAEKATRLPQPLGALVNLCAAYLRAGELEPAGEYCAKAVQEAESGMVITVGVSRAEAKRARAMAFANYGVYQAIIGDRVSSIASLEKARGYDSRSKNIEFNLSLLQAPAVAAVEYRE